MLDQSSVTHHVRIVPWDRIMWRGLDETVKLDGSSIGNSKSIPKEYLAIMNDPEATVMQWVDLEKEDMRREFLDAGSQNVHPGYQLGRRDGTQYTSSISSRISFHMN